MITDFFANNSSDERQEEITKSYANAKRYFTENIPYKLLPSPISRTTKIVIFSQHFIDTFRMMLSSPDDACIVQMSEREREVWYSFSDYQDSLTIDNPEMLLVVTELNNCIINEITCKTESYLDLCFNEEFTWTENPITIESTNQTTKLTQDQYDTKLSLGEIIVTTTYVITLDNVTVAIYVGEVLIWSI